MALVEYSLLWSTLLELKKFFIETFTQGKDLQDGFKKAEAQIKTRQEDLLKAKEEYVKLNKSLKSRANKLQVHIFISKNALAPSNFLAYYARNT